MTRLLPVVVAALCFIPASGRAGAAAKHTTSGPVLGVSGDEFMVDGRRTFLLGVSYFDALHWHASDIETLSRLRYNLIRVWLDWDKSGFFDAGGRLVARRTLIDLNRACAAHGIVVNVTILNTSTGFSDVDRAVRETVEALLPYRNVVYDLVNEHDHSGRTFSHDEVKRLAAVARRADPKAIVTVSSTEGHLIDDDGKADLANLRAEAVDAGLDIVSPHFPRTRDWASKTAARVEAMKAGLAALHRTMPVFLQEEARRGYGGMNPAEVEFIEAAAAARDAGAAGWIFHTEASFALKTRTFFERLDPVERATLEALPGRVGLVRAVTADHRSLLGPKAPDRSQ